MKGKKISVVLLIFAVIPMLLSCSNIKDDISKSKAYSIFIIRNDKQVYDVPAYFTEYDMSSENFYTFPEVAVGSDNAIVNPDIKDRDITFNGTTTKYYYEYSYHDGLYFYEPNLLNCFKNPIYNATVSIYDNSNDIGAATFNDYNFRIADTPITTETELLRVCSNFLSQYTDLSNTTPIIQTFSYDADNAIIEIDNGFKAISELPTAAIAKYIIHYEWSRNDFQRYENAYISINNEGYITHFSTTKKAHADLLNNTEIDFERLDNLITEKVKKLCQNDLGYTLDSIKFKEKGLYIINERLCAVVRLSPLLLPSDGGSAVSGVPISLLITL